LYFVDLYLIHFPGAPPGRGKAPPGAEVARQLRLDSWRALEKLYREGKCRAIGVSNYLKRHMDELSEAVASKQCEHMPMVNQAEFHPYYNNKETFELCAEMKIQFEVRLNLNYLI
jgi:diketogulonate reductase-like aldo/keto reductase